MIDVWNSVKSAIVLSAVLLCAYDAHAHCGCADDNWLASLRENATGDPLDTSSYVFQPLPDRAAVLVVSAHPDDEGLFFGGSLPYYSQVRNLPTVLIGMTSGDSGIGNQLPENRFLREAELREAAATYGLKYEPIYARFDDGGGNGGLTPNSPGVTNWTQFPNTGNDALDYLNPTIGNPVEYTARWIRKLRPEVLLTSDNEGDYGHKDHKHTSDAVVAAYNMAADDSVTILDEQGYELPSWTVTKFYVHDAQFNDMGDGSGHQSHLFHTRWEQAYDELGGLTPRQVTDAALLRHESQGIPASRSYFGGTDFASAYVPSELWTLLQSVVGPDTPGSGILDVDPSFQQFDDVSYGDFFEGVDLTMFASYLADSNLDGVVDNRDLAIMQANFGLSVPAGSVGSGDANGDGIVDQADINLYTIAVPEPSSIVVFYGSIIVLLRRRASRQA